MLKFAGTKNTEQAPKEVHRAEVAKTNDALAKAEKTMREHARSYGYKNVDGLKVSVTDKGAVLYDPDTNHVIVSMREEGGKPDFTGPTTRRK